MDPEFAKIVAELPSLLEKLQASTPLTIETGLRQLPQKGVYAFYENDEPIYVGRSNRIRSRIREHGAESSGHESATFAYKLLLDELGEAGGHSSSRTRKQIQDCHKPRYQAQRARIRKMQVRAVGIEGQQVQALFEIYAILALGPLKYNSFHTT